MAGTLFVVATPIGNLEDITLRALRTLREVDLIAAEDTRRTAKLLAHYRIQRPMVSLHAHNEHREAPRLIERIAKGTSVALVSDAGTPGISDPGEILVRLAHERGIKVTPIPGPSSIATALSISGQPASEFVFMGFPPKSGQARVQWMERLLLEPRTVVAFEAPHRIARTVKDLTESLVTRQIMIYRELTKINEELVISPQDTSPSEVKELGEFVLVVSPKELSQPSLDESSSKLATAASMIGCMTINRIFELDDAIRLSADALGLEPAAVRKAWKKHRIAENRRLERLS